MTAQKPHLPDQTRCRIARAVRRNLGSRVTKQQPLARNLLCGVAQPLVMRNAAFMSRAARNR
jgi:hypothetical protein